jgi:hypothetical protein
MNAILSWLGARLAEPSSWAGLAAIATSVQQAVSNPSATSIATVLGGILAIIVPEGAAAKPPAITPPAK